MLGKKDYAVEEASDRQDGFEMGSLNAMGGTIADENEMQTLGRVQQLNVSLQCIYSHYRNFAADSPQRNFRFISTLGFACTLMSTWEIALMYEHLAIVVIDAL